MSGDVTALPRVAVVIPIFRHSVLQVEAIESALAQDASFGTHLVLVNDGCPHRETDLVCLDYARSLPDRVTYLRKPNGGLSDARNYGIRHILDHMPAVEAVFMLDADNQLRPASMARAMAVLDAKPQVGWVYPNIDMFGLQSAHDYGGPYSLLIHSAMNISEAGSLIRRAVFAAGVMFDTTFKGGFEDWEFFLSAGAAGFRGENLEEFGFLYRKRAESMLAESERDKSAITAKVRQKHKAAFHPRALIALEQQELPRYAIHLVDTGEIRLTTDPSLTTETLTAAQYDHRFWLAKANPSRAVLPPITVVTTKAALDQLTATGMLHGAFWKLEALTERGTVAALVAQGRDEDRMGFAPHAGGDGSHVDASLIMVGPEFLRAVATGETSDWADSMSGKACQPEVNLMELSLPQTRLGMDRLKRGSAVFDLLSLIHRLRGSIWREGATRRTDWREGDIGLREWSHVILRRNFQGEAVFPRVKKDGPGRDIGLVLPLIEFGGVEKVALNMARAAKARGDRAHLFVLSHSDAAISTEWRETVDSVTFLSDPDFHAWGGGTEAYFGTEIPKWSQDGNHDRALAMLFWLDAVIDFHAGALVGVMSRLKRLGIRTASSLHLTDLSAVGRPTGNAYLTFAFEHAFDVIAPCSVQMADWCHAMGMPNEKIIPVPNAPSFAISADQMAQTRAARAGRTKEPLRVLYLGRLDVQKGLERLTEVMEQSAGMALIWRVIGKAVMQDQPAPVSATLKKVLEPALTTPDELIEAFAWADVLILLSEFEGLPLTILEALRQGVVPIATDVGSVCEVLNARNGFLVPLARAVPASLAALKRLSLDRALLDQLSQAAEASMVGRNWAQSTEAFFTEMAKPQKVRPD